MPLFARKDRVRDNRIDNAGRWPVQITRFELLEDYEHPAREYPEIFVVEDGGFLHESDSGTQALRRGSVVVNHPGNRHAVKQPEGARIARVRFLPEWFANDLEQIVKAPDLFSLIFAHLWLDYPSESTLFTFTLSEDRMAAVESDLYILWTELNEGRQMSALAKITLFKLLLHISDEFAIFWRQQNRIELRPEILTALLWMEDAISRGTTIQLKDMEPEIGMTLDHFGKIFKKVAGITPAAYFQQRRLHRGAWRLLTTDERIREVAKKTGFTDFDQFSKLFQKQFELSPGVYRQKFRPELKLEEEEQEEVQEKAAAG